jgi:hypothetical protein
LARVKFLSRLFTALNSYGFRVISSG